MNLKQIRISQALTVPALARSSGVPVRTIENIEKTGNSTVANAIKLADALGVSLDELCREKTEE